uniref:Uncharacterized protein n=1 Tax=viral metagenome TaxID=1070528 RepID=A0A6C0IG41_9ZZZZ
MSGVSISDMHNFVETMGSSDMQMSSTIGNVVELGSEDLGNDFGASLLSNTRVSARPAVNTTQSVSSLEPIQDIGVGSFEPLESISFDLPSGQQQSPEININRESVGSNDLFSNMQTASGPSINLAAATRLSPEEERKKKIDLINKLNRLETKGYTLTKRYTMDNTLEEIQLEYDRLVDAKNLEASLRFQRQCLMGVATGAEFLNSKFNPFDWELDGWSESVHENIEDFDEVFEELYDKYKGRGNMPPEAKLMMSLVGSGFMFHMSNSFFRSKMNNVDPSDIFKNNPQLAKQFAAAAAQQAGPGFGNFMGAAMGQPPSNPMGQQQPTGAFFQAPQQQMPQQMQTPQHVAAQQPAAVHRREMAGPRGVEDILKTFQEVRASDMEANPIMMPEHRGSYDQHPAQQAAFEIASIHSASLSDVSGETGHTASGRRGRRKASAPVENTMILNL